MEKESAAKKEYDVKLDEEDVQFLYGLCDLALKSGGLNAYQQTTKILLALPKAEAKGEEKSG